MLLFKFWSTPLAMVTLLALTACNGAGSVPSSAAVASPARVTPEDTTSVLKLLTKDVVIGSTVDPSNGDTAPRSIAVATMNYGKIKKNQIFVCNFADSSGTAGNGTTIEQFSPVASSKPTTFVQSTDFKGCDGSAVTSGDQMYATGYTSKKMVRINQSGKITKVYGSPITLPLGDSDAPPLYSYSPEYVYIGNADTGAVDSISLGGYGTKKVLQVINGFPVNKQSGFSAQGPYGIAYWCGSGQGTACKKKADTLFIADGACDAVVAIDHASNLLVKDEVTVQSNCTKFKCKAKKDVCGKLVLSGSPLDAPGPATALANGNVIVANTAGGNTLVEMTPTGQVLDTKVVDTSGTQGIYALFAIGTSDKNTALYYTDTNDNSLHELEQ